MVSASQVKELRAATGVGMMECKKALQDTNGDMKQAINLLREKGLAKAAKKSGRVASEGVVTFAIHSDETEAGIIELNCETDFAAKNESFQAMSKELTELVLTSKLNSVDDAKKTKLSSGSTVDESLVQLVSTIGENINLRRVQHVSATNGFLVGYNHMHGKIGVLVAFEGEKTSKALEVASDIAMHVAATAPRYLDSSEVSSSELDEEKEILKKQLLEQGKPEAMLDKILQGQIKKFYAENCLVDQAFVKEPKFSVAQYLKNSGTNLKLTRFVRFQLGEGIEVNKGDFSEEVSSLVK